MYSILFVCTGNMCRSPLAQGVLDARISTRFPEKLRDFVTVDSCGIYAYAGNKPPENAVTAASKIGADIGSLRAKPITRKLIGKSDIILCMSVEHYNFVKDYFTPYLKNTHLLKSFGKGRKRKFSDSIPDPIGLDITFYEKVLDEIVANIDRITPVLIECAEAKYEEQQG